MYKKLTLTRLSIVITGSLLFCTAFSVSAGLMGVTDIRITSTTPTWIQVTEVTALKTTGGDAASVLEGAIATSSGFGFGGSPEKAIDDLNAGGTHRAGEFHSDSTNLGEFLNIALFGPTELDSVTIFGRSDCCSHRDIFNIELLDDKGSILFQASGLDARASHQVTVTLPNTSVPEPGTLALVGLSLTGLGFIRSRKMA